MSADSTTRLRELVKIMTYAEPGSEEFKKAQQEYLRISPKTETTAWQSPESQTDERTAQAVRAMLAMPPHVLLQDLERMETMYAADLVKISGLEPGSRKALRVETELQHMRQQLEYAYIILDRPELQREARAHSSEQGLNTAGRGLMLLVGGAFVTGVWYLLTDPGDKFVVFWGAMAGGALMIVIGLGRSKNFW